jgi:hypothetical protein
MFNKCRCKNDLIIGINPKIRFEFGEYYEFVKLKHEEGVEYFEVGTENYKVPMTYKTFSSNFDYIQIVRCEKLDYILNNK